MRQTLDISWQTIVKIFIAGFVFYILFLARHVIIWFFFALIISILLEPAINLLIKLRIPKLLAVILIYLSILGVLGLVIYLTAPIFVFEIAQLSENIPDYFERINPLLKSLGIQVAQNFEDFTAILVSKLQDSSVSIAKAVSVFFGGISSTIVIFFFAFYISLEDKGIERFLALLTPKKYERQVINLFERAQSKVAGWFGARILACIFVGILSFIVFFLFGTKYSFILALASGALNFIPFIGPLITAMLVIVFVGASNSWLIAFYIIIALTIIQELENKFITPLLMQKFLALPPVLVLMSILIGGTLFGILGIILIVPVSGIVYEFLKEFLENRKRREEDMDLFSAEKE